MKKWEKEIVQKQINSEQQVIYRLKDSYKFAMKDVEEKILALQSRPQTQSVIYQLKYQQGLQKQLEEIYSKMSNNWYKDIDTYLKDCYEDGFFSTMYSLHNEGIPLVMPFNQAEMAQMAAQSDYEGIKLSEKLYNDSVEMARISRQEITRGIATNADYATIANRVHKRGEGALYNATRIVRTESHRITNEVKMNTITKAKDMGADLVKQWDSTVDARTRSTHVGLDGQQREIEQPFKSESGHKAMYPGGFGVAAEDINCRCVMLQRARWALDKSELDKSVGDLSNATDEQLQKWADKLGVSVDELIKASNGIIEPDGTINHCIKAKNYNDFKKKYKTKSADQTAQYQAQLDVLNEEKKKALKDFGLDPDDPNFDENWELWDFISEEDYADNSIKPFVDKISKLNEEINGLTVKTGGKASLKTLNDTGLIKNKTSTSNTANVTDLDFEAFKKNAKHFTSGYEADKYHKEKNFVQSRWDNNLSPNEKRGIYTYTTNAYSTINRDLRTDNLANSRYKNEINFATKGLEKCSIAEDTVVFRGMTGGIDDFSIWCGIPKTELSKKAVQDSLIGSRITEKGFMSTGTNAGSAWSGLKLEVYLPKGSQAMYVDPISAYKGEYEILVQRNSTFEIMEVKTDSRGYIEGLVLKLVEQKH